MAEKKAIILDAASLDLGASSEALDKLNKKAVKLINANTAGLMDLLKGMGGVHTDAAGLAAAAEGDNGLMLLSGGDAELAAVLDAADRRTLVVVLTAKAVALYGLAVNNKIGTVDRAVTAQDLMVTIATIADLEIDATCTGAIIYQAMKNPNLKLDEIRKLKDALIRMESVIQRDNREPWDKHDCA